MRADARPTASRRRRRRRSPADRRRCCRRSASRASRPACSRTVAVGSAKPATCGFALSSAFCAAASVLLGSPRLPKIASATAALMLAATMPEPASAVSKRHRDRLAGVRRVRAGDDEHRLRAALPRRHRLVAQVGVAREDAPWSSARRPRGSSAARGRSCPSRRASRSCRSRSSGFRHDDAVAGEDDGAGDVAVVGEGQRPDVASAAEGTRRAVGRPVRTRRVSVEPPSFVPAVNSNGSAEVACGPAAAWRRCAAAPRSM